ncbi:MAG: glycoside hydrolase family 1 protein [Candidatus Omnitrophica bacterium]|nr:glycoside hydrolase family 1 protein [Candidatus Omnitrophota bacterium]
MTDSAAQKIPFLWGAATSSHQVEGDNRFNDWWDWEVQGKFKTPSKLACDQYRLFREDIELISRLGHNGHRFSLEWSRFEPEEDEWNDDAFKHYEEIFKELHARGIEPVVTLHHFTNPVWFNQKGGWLDKKSIFYFNRYAERVVRAYSRYVRFWVTINEPLIYLYYGFFSGEWPPGIKSYPDSLTVVRSFLEAHIAAYRTIHHIYEKNQRPVYVSVAHHMTAFTPCRKESLLDRLAVYLRNWFVNDAFFDALQTGFLFFPGIFCEFLSGSRTLDYLGVNYYTRDFIRFTGLGEDRSIGAICGKDHHQEEAREFNQMGWEIYPEGIYQVLNRLKRFQLPIIVTENGVCAADDEQRVRFIRDHLGQVKRAKDEGVPVQGFFYWSLLDNFEWAHGFDPRFGMVEVDYATQTRKIRPSAQVFSESCRQLFCGF